MMRLWFESSRGRAPRVSLSQAIAQGLAADGGLYVPDKIPTVDVNSFSAGSSVPQVARAALAGFFEGDDLQQELGPIADASFDFPGPTTKVAACRDPLYVLELYHGPTAAFKDYGARFLAECQQRLQRSADSQALTILVATSGDTGARWRPLFTAAHGRGWSFCTPRDW